VEHLEHSLGVIEGPLRGDDRLRERVAAVDGPENGAAAAEDSGHVPGRQRPRFLGVNEAVEAVLEAEHLDVGVGGGFHDRPNDRVQARRIAAAGQDSNFFHGRHAETS
jgi:hypothetical protein